MTKIILLTYCYFLTLRKLSLSKQVLLSLDCKSNSCTDVQLGSSLLPKIRVVYLYIYQIFHFAAPGAFSVPADR